MIINAVSYCRFSSSNQREASIEIQQEHINKYCKENGLTIIREYVDRAFSATSDNRPQFQQMIKDAQSGLFSYVVVYNSSRFCRNIQDHLRYRSVLESYGIRLICVNDNFDETTPEGDLMANFMMSINQYYSKDLGRKTYLGCLETAKECKHVGGVPLYGYSVDNEQKYVINEEEAKVVRIIFKMLEEDKSYKDICEYLTLNGYRKRDNTNFRGDFYYMARNRKYIGEYSWNVGTRKNKVLKHGSTDGQPDIVVIPHGMPAIITEEQFFKVQKIIEKRKNNKGGQKNNYLLSSILKCGTCGYKMCVDRNINGNGKSNWVRLNYRCYTRNRSRGDCDTKDVSVENLDTYITNLLFNILLNERYSKNIYKLIREKSGKDYENTRRELINTQAQIDKCKSEIKNLITSLAEAKSIVYTEIVKEIERLTLRKNDLELRVSELRFKLNEMPCFNEEMILKSILRMKSHIKSKTVGSIKPLLKVVIKEVILDNCKVRVVVNLNAYLTSKSNKDFEVVIVEDTQYIKNLEEQYKQKLNWNALVLEA